MNKLDLDYCNLLKDILENGVEKNTRNGKVLSVFGRTIRHKMSEGFPILTTKHISLRNVATELIWFLKGDTNIKYLIDNGCNIWNGDVYKNYLKNWSNVIPGDDKFKEDWYNSSGVEAYNFNQEQFIEKLKTDEEFCKKWGDLGKIYGYQWRNWNTRRLDLSNECEDRRKGNPIKLLYIDQIKNLVNDLKNNPDSRRLMVNAWNVGDLDKMVLPPCHYGFQCYTRELSLEEKIKWVMKNTDVELENLAITEEAIKETTPKRALSLLWNQRSVDSFLGLPYNIASYGLLLEILAKEVNMIPDELIGDLGDTHLYLNHLEQAKEQIGRELSWEERREFCTEEQRYEHGNLSPFVEQLIHYQFNSWYIPKRTREPYPLTKLMFMSHLKDFKSLLFDGTYGVVLRPKDFILDNYQYHPKIEAPLSN